MNHTMKYKAKKNQLFTLLSIATLTFIMVSCTSSDKKNAWDDENLIGKVKSFKQFTYEAKEKFGNIEKEI